VIAATIPTGSCITIAILPIVSCAQSPGRYSPEIFLASCSVMRSRSLVASISPRASCSGFPASHSKRYLKNSRFSSKSFRTRLNKAIRSIAAISRTCGRAISAEAIAEATSRSAALGNLATILPSTGLRTENSPSDSGYNHLPLIRFFARQQPSAFFSITS